MDIHSVRLCLKTKSIYDIPLRVTYYARVSSESDGIMRLYIKIFTGESTQRYFEKSRFLWGTC